MKPLLVKGSVVNMTVSMVTAELMRLTLNVNHPEDLKGEDADKPRLQSIVFETTPEELDDPSISFVPLVKAWESLNDAISAAATASTDAAGRKASIKAGEKSDGQPPAPAAPNNPPPGRATRVSKAAAAAAAGVAQTPKPPEPPTETAEAKELREQAEYEKAEAERKALEEAAKKKAAADEVLRRKAEKQAEIARLQKELESSEEDQPPLPGT